jgi:hypothetical protein
MIDLVVQWSTGFLRQTDSIFEKCMGGAALLTQMAPPYGLADSGT